MPKKEKTAYYCCIAEYELATQSMPAQKGYNILTSLFFDNYYLIPSHSHQPCLKKHIDNCLFFGQYAKKIAIECKKDVKEESFFNSCFHEFGTMLDRHIKAPSFQPPSSSQPIVNL